MGHQPSIRTASRGCNLAVTMSRYRVAAEATMQAIVTAWMRALMTEGASLLRDGDGLVDFDR